MAIDRKRRVRRAVQPVCLSGRLVAWEAEMTRKWEWDPAEELDEPEPHTNPGSRTRSRGKMPVGSEAKAKAAGKTTYRSRRASKRVSRTVSGIRNRRNKRLD
jgi:hypothetical protein